MAEKAIRLHCNVRDANEPEQSNEQQEEALQVTTSTDREGVEHGTTIIAHWPGTIVDATNGGKPDGVRHEADGDTHGWLKVDPPSRIC